MAPLFSLLPYGHNRTSCILPYLFKAVIPNQGHHPIHPRIGSGIAALWCWWLARWLLPEPCGLHQASILLQWLHWLEQGFASCLEAGGLLVVDP